MVKRNGLLVAVRSGFHATAADNLGEFGVNAYGSVWLQINGGG